jgi:peptidoglycan/LPS O-acetylase OafA/YrhL
MRAPPRAGLPHVRALDGVRGGAVAAVLVFHGGIALLPGGFLGVDAFFVLSGFLITTLLLTEQARTGRIDLPAFWARRARRLLPALLVMLTTVLVVSRWLLSAEELRALRGDALATIAYAANWHLMDRGGYFAQTAPPSPLQHTWSLAIEEQFYLVWPILLLAVLAACRRFGDRRRRAVVAVLCLGGAVESAIAAAVLSGADRLYYGTDTRAAALLIGGAVAAVLAGRPPADGRRHPLLGAFALAGAVVIGWLWATADGAAPWLYRGGLLAAAVSTAAVIAHAVRSPRSITARVLSVAPLAWLGQISYGVYLWHWPLFQWINADRTGLTGTQLFGVRCAATLAVATVSYVVVERPLRTASWLRRPKVTPSSALAGLAATAVVAVVATVPPPVVTRSPVNVDHALSQVLARAPHPGRAGSARARIAPIDRRGRKPGKLPRITFLGDSVSWSLGTYLPPQHELDISVRAIQGCGIATLPDIRYLNAPHTNYPGCTRWAARWTWAVRTDDPDVAVVLLDRWELMDRRLGGRYQHVGDPGYDEYLGGLLDTALGIAGSRGARVVVLTAPYTHRAERPDGGLYPEDTAARVNAWNALLRAAAARHHAAVLDLNRKACPNGRFTWSVNGVRIRSDGLHFTPTGVREVLAPWLLPRLAAAAVDPSPTS